MSRDHHGEPAAPVRQAGSDAEAHDLLTVDVWDTLLRRRCHPDGVKLHVCRYVLLQWHDLLDPVCRDAWLLLRLRQQAEADIGNAKRVDGFDDEYGHREVYRRWLELAGFDLAGVPDEGLERILAEIEQVEISQEKRVSYVDPTIVATLGKFSAKRTLFLSDFYMPASAIKDLLTHHGLDEVVSEGLVSCDVGFNKRSGRLYGHLKERMDIAPDTHLHIGDNLWSDIRVAREAGLKAVHFQPDEEHRRRQAREADFADRQSALAKALDALMGCAPPSVREERDFYDFGRQCSPLLVGFVLMTMERAVLDKVEALYFFTREGEFFLEIYRQLAQGDVLGFSSPPAALLMVSRLATFAGSLREFSTTELMRLWNQYSVQSLQALFKSLAIEPAGFSTLAMKHGLDLESPIRYPWQDSRVLAFFEEPEVHDRITCHLAAQKRGLLDYLASAGIDSTNKRVGIVDIGWRGTIQDNLAYALPDTEIKGYYLGLNRYLNDQPGNVGKHAFGPNLNYSDTERGLLNYVAPIEMLCNSPNGSVEGYVTTGDGVRAIRNVDEGENKVHHAYVRHFQAGILDSIPYWADFIRTHAYSSNEFLPMALGIWNRIAHYPPANLSRAYFQLNHNEVFGVGGFIDKRRRMGLGDVLMAYVSRKKRIQVQGYLAESGWTPGLLRCPDLPWGLRAALRMLMLGHHLKRRLFSRLAG